MRLAIVLAWVGVFAAPAHANVTTASEMGFAIRHEVLIAADSAAVYDLLVHPARWWNGEHSYSGNASNLRMDAWAGGCFCELVPASDSKATASVEHGHILYAAPGRHLRLSGALGPLQSEAVIGTLDFDLIPADKSTRVILTYVVGGFSRTPHIVMAPVVDRVLGGQLHRLRQAAEPREGHDPQ